MEENITTIEEGAKPFSVLERFRQLKKEKEQSPASEKDNKTLATTETVFKASTSSSVNGEPGKEEDFHKGRGKLRGKRNLIENDEERLCKRVTGELHQGQKEQDVGITEFITDSPGFHVILKHRYTDFHVNEIDKNGKVVRLTSTDIPNDDTEPETSNEEEDSSLMTPEQWAALGEIVEKKLSTTVDVDVTDSDKNQRQQIHKAVKKRFGVHIYSNTKSIEDKKIIQIGWGSNQNNRRFCNWPRGRPEYLHFVVFKENSDITEVISVLSRLTLVKATRFGYAGTKDKRAVTTQQMCVRRTEAQRFKSCYKLRGIAVGNYSYKWNNLRLGDLNGNRFRIVLRHVKVNDDIIKDAIDKFKNTGFINYFGLQRFGQSALVPTYSIGKAILQGNWKLAVELILKPRLGESCYKDVKEAREIWWKTRDASEALKPLTRKERTIEGKILMGLKKNGPNAYQNAFDNLPTQTVTMYLHSFQSLIWNKVVSRRIREFGLKVLPGDLVEVQSWMENGQEENGSEHLDARNSESETESVDNLEAGTGSKIQVHALTPVEAETASIYDVLYPLPGDDIRLPKNEIAKWYTEFLAENGHSFECFQHVNQKYGMYGTYRHMIEKAEELNWQTVHYSDPDEDLLLSELEVLRGKPPLKLETEGPYKAVILEFNLKACCYATMAIRELTKCETSISNQAMLTNQAREEDQVAKKLKMNEKEQEIDPECSKDENSTHSLQELENNGDMDTDGPSCTEHVFYTQNMNSDVDEDGDMSKREAEADNIINRYLESNYH